MGRFRSIKGAILSLTLCAAAISSCSKIDNTIGADFIPADQELRIGSWSSVYNDESGTKIGRDIFETRLFRSDSIASLNLTAALLGKQSDATFGTRETSLYSQYISYYHYNEDYLVDDPIFDSIRLYYYISNYGGDTTVVQNFEIFEVTDNSFLDDDKIAKHEYFTNFTLPEESYDSSSPIFTFSFPNPDEEIYTDGTYITLTETDASADFISRLVMRDATEEERLEVYGSDEAFVEHFKGLYIRPTADSPSDAALYFTDLESTGLLLMGHTMDPDEPTEVQDTIAMMYTLSYSDADYTCNSIIMVENDYTNAAFDIADVASDAKKVAESPTTGTMYVEGLGGVVSALSFKETFFDDMDAAINSANLEVIDPYTSVYFNQARLIIYLPKDSSAGYDYNDINALTITPWLNDAHTRLGLYSQFSNYLSYSSDNDTYYKTLYGVTDYIYDYEDSYGYEIEFGGYLNRSWGAYIMNIPSFLQAVWNEYVDLKEASVDGVVNMDDLTTKTFYLGPSSSLLYTLLYGSMQGQVDESLNNAPVRLEVTYTLIK